MSLPKLVSPKFTINLPSDGREVIFRPFLVKEEKALLMASEGDDPESQIRAIKDTINACVEGVDVSKLPYFDIEYLFLNLRAKSVGEEAKFVYRHRNGKNLKGEDCDVATEVIVKIDEVKVRKNPNHETKFMIDEKYGLKMRWPTIDDIRLMTNKENSEIYLMASCIEFVYDDSDVYPPDNVDDAVKFIEQMNTKQYEKLANWFSTMPALHHELTYKCSGCGQEDTVKFEGVSDFF